MFLISNANKVKQTNVHETNWIANTVPTRCVTRTRTNESKRDVIIYDCKKSWSTVPLDTPTTIGLLTSVLQRIHFFVQVDEDLVDVACSWWQVLLPLRTPHKVSTLDSLVVQTVHMNGCVDVNENQQKQTVLSKGIFHQLELTLIFWHAYITFKTIRQIEINFKEISFQQTSIDPLLGRCLLFISFH